MKTVIHGLAIGILMGFLNLPLDSAVSLVSQLGLITTTKKVVTIVRNTTKKMINSSKR
ncbi:MAG: hypothetical protein QW724_00235 [Nitrososphaerota archaeon]